MVNGYDITRTRNYIFLVSNKSLIKQKFLLRITSLLNTYKKYIQIILHKQNNLTREAIH